jgi:hypothetical protein
MGVVKRVVRCHVLGEAEAICTTVSETVVQKSVDRRFHKNECCI